MKIVAATDLSSRGSVAVERAHKIAQATRAEVLVVCAVDDDQPADIVEMAVTQAQRYLDDVGGTPPSGGRAPGWLAGIVVAERELEEIRTPTVSAPDTSP